MANINGFVVQVGSEFFSRPRSETAQKRHLYGPVADADFYTDEIHANTVASIHSGIAIKAYVVHEEGEGGTDYESEPRLGWRWNFPRR